ncbi:MAG: glycine--tRNA ligase subunit beta [Acidiferrobacterales bacterium]
MKKKATRKKRVTRPVAADLLVELGTEELPPKSLLKLSQAFADEVFKGLGNAGLVPDPAKTPRSFAAPRRLAVRVPQVLLRQPDRDQERRGPALQAAFDANGNPSKAAEGFARSCGTSVDKLDRLKTDKGEWLVYRERQKGEAAARLIPEILDQALKALPIAKRMRWSDLDAEFLRPVHWLVLLHGDKVVPAEVLSVKSGRESRGHRFHHPKPVKLKHAGEYEIKLKKAFVMVDFEGRRKRIQDGAVKLATRAGGKAVIEADLLDEVTSLVEWPEPLLAGFEDKYLDVPAEALITTMQDNQKYFPVVNKRGKLLPHFITVANIRSKQKKKVQQGNERVIRARFSDAEFFWNSDRKTKLESRVDRLKNVVFHNKLGTLHDKAERVSKLAVIVAEELGSDVNAAQRAGMLAKADLMSGMVGEFPELQGVMGCYYAAHDGESDEIAAAMEEQYLPRFAGDYLPKTRTGNALAVADKLDTIVGIFSTGEVPTGDKDPFALRRAALGVLRIIIENKLDLNLWTLLRSAAVHFTEHDATTLSNTIYDFMMDRLRAYYDDAGVKHDVFEAVLACRPEHPLDFDGRVRAVQAFQKLKEAESLAAANKRISNILKQAGDLDWDHVSKELLQEEHETKLAERISKMQTEVEPLFAAADYTAAMKKLATLRPEVDNFFDHVMVMVDEEAVRDNRLAVLQGLRKLFLRVADLSRLQE